jgi:hypothetical protein
LAKVMAERFTPKTEASSDCELRPPACIILRTKESKSWEDMTTSCLQNCKQAKTKTQQNPGPKPGASTYALPDATKARRTSGGGPMEHTAPPMATSSGTESAATGTETHHMPDLLRMRTPLHAGGSWGAAYTASRLAWAKDRKPMQAT